MPYFRDVWNLVELAVKPPLVRGTAEGPALARRTGDEHPIFGAGTHIWHRLATFGAAPHIWQVLTGFLFSLTTRFLLFSQL